MQESLNALYTLEACDSYHRAVENLERTPRRSGQHLLRDASRFEVLVLYVKHNSDLDWSVNCLLMSV